MLCAVDARLGPGPEARTLIATIESSALSNPDLPAEAAFAEAIERGRWVILAGSYIEPRAWCHWAIFSHDDLDHVLREVLSHHLSIAAACGVDAKHALGFSIAPYSHARDRLGDAFSRYQKALRLEASPRVQ